MPNHRLLVGKWMPTQRELIGKWLKKEVEEFKKNNAEKFDKLESLFPIVGGDDEVLQEFVRNVPKIDQIAKDLELTKPMKELFIAMGREPEVGMLMVQMMRQQEIGIPCVIMLIILNMWCRMAPRYIDESLGITIPVPIGCILTYAMATPAGFAGFVNKRINELFKNILDDYGVYLTSADSRNVLVDDIPGGWFTKKALEAMGDFDDTFKCTPGAPYKGFASFDAFFTRHFYDKARPIGDPTDDKIIVNACENAPYQINRQVKRHDAFWVKSQPYSLQYILDNDERLSKFVGGTVYQGFLSPHTYHRFHAPVSGKILRADVIDGTYFSQPYYEDKSANYIASQPYLAHVAARGIIIIEADCKELGLVAFVPIGMVDVSTVDLKALDGVKHVKKGQNIGTFHFGGSSHLLIFEKNKNIHFDLQGIKPDPLGNEFLKVRTTLGIFTPDPRVK